MLNLDHNVVRKLDWVLSLIVFGYGAFTASWMFMALGIAGCVAAWYRPASRMSAVIKRSKK